MTPAYVGVDVAFAKDKRLPVCTCVKEQGRLVPLPLRRHHRQPPRGRGNVATLDQELVTTFAREARDYIAAVARDRKLSIVRIGIDAPRTCRPEAQRRRACEMAMDEARISCFTTPSRAQFEEIERKVRAHLDSGGLVSRLPHANQLWMLVGFALFRELTALGECIEVFPQATVREIGAGHTRKTTAEGAIARHRTWMSRPDRTEAVARSIYLRLPEDVRLWRLGKEFVPVDRGRLLSVFAP